MPRSLRKSRGRVDRVSVTVIPKTILESEEYAALTAYEVKLLIDILVQFNGYTNNGDLQCTWRLMKQQRGWRSPDTLARALRGLIDKGFIVKTRQGGMNKCSLYAITWVEIHECKGKLDVRPTRTALGLWRKNKSLIREPEYISTAAVLKVASK